MEPYMPDDSIACRILSQENEIEDLASEWQDLHSRVNTCLFGGYDWFRTWWQTIGNRKNRKLHIIAASKNGKLVGLLPLMIEKNFGLGILKWAGNELFDYCGSLAEDKDVAQSLWETARKSPHYDFALIEDVRLDSRDAEMLEAFATKAEHNKAHYISLNHPTGKEWQKSYSKGHRRKFKGQSRRLEEIGSVKFDVLQQGPVPHDIIDNMVRHKITWCSNNRKMGIFSNPYVLPAFRRMADLAAKENKLFLGLLKCGDTIVAYRFGFIDRGVLYYYFASYDPEWLDYSPGILTLVHTTSWAVDNGLKESDFMRGDESYKLHYASGTRDLPVFCFARTSSGLFGLIIYKLHSYGCKKAKSIAKQLPGWAQNALLSFRKTPHAGKKPA
jgi:CelD/BcsL family acetyltransferase involved in cellulose biosynthesis